MSRRAAICCTLLQTKFASTRVSKARPGLRPQDRRQIGNFRQGRAVHTRNRPVNNFVTCFVPERARDTSTGKPHRIVGRCLCRGVLAAHSEVRRIAHLGPIALRFVLVGPALFLARHFLSVINTYLYKRGIKILNGLRGGGIETRRGRFEFWAVVSRCFVGVSFWHTARLPASNHACFGGTYVLDMAVEVPRRFPASIERRGSCCSAGCTKNQGAPEGPLGARRA